MPPLDPVFKEYLLKLWQQKSDDAIARVVRRCHLAAGDGCLDLSQCTLRTVPDAVFHLTRDSHILCCSLSSNFISQLSPELPIRFSQLSELNLSLNKLTYLPDEISYCQSLTKLDISHNGFIEIPHMVFRLDKLTVLQANNNFIIEVDISKLPKTSSLQEIDLRANPLLPACHDVLAGSAHVVVLLTERRAQEWEDLCV